MVKGKFSLVKRWMWPFYVFGWLAGALNLIFWIFLYGAHLSREEEDQEFFNKHTHARIAYWGMFILGIYLLATLVIIFE